MAGAAGSGSGEPPPWAASVVRAWRVTAVLLGGLGLVLVPQVLDVETVIPAVVTVGIIVAVLAGGIRSDSGRPLLWQLTMAARDGLVAVLAATAVAGWFALLGAPALLGLLLMAGTSPPAVRLAVRRLDHRPPSSPAAPHDELHGTRPPPVIEVRPDRVTAMSSRQIGAAWCRSGLDLRTIRSVATRIRVVQLRQLYLDELERRDPVALHSWLASQPRAVSDPSKFFHDSPPDTLAS